VYRGQNDIDFPRLYRYMLVISLVAVIVSIVSLVAQGLNLAIDFEGGTVWEIPTESMTTDQAEAVLADFDKENGAKVQELSDANGTRVLRVQADASSVTEGQEIAAAYAEEAGVEITDIGVNTVGPSWGSEITKQAVKSLVVFLILIVLYIAWQLEWRMAAAALIAVSHDVLVTLGVYSIFRFEVTPATVISFLTILGYSIYDTIVVYDRVQDNATRYDRSGQYTYTAIMRRSMNQVLMRSVNTGVVSLLPVITMLLVGAQFFGQSIIRDFALALLVGQLAGMYSSIFIAAPFVVYFKEREPKYRRVRQRAEERGTLEAAEHIPLVASMSGGRPVAVVGDTTTTIAAQTQANKAAQYQRAHPPRPRKQGKKR
jgi:preprotein translocase subunit SecF